MESLSRRNRNSSPHLRGLVTSASTLTSKSTSITGLTKTGNCLTSNCRLHNEHETDLRRTQIYALNAVYYGGLLSFARLFVIGLVGRLNGWKRYDRDTYLEMDIGDLPPGEVMQIVWNGIPVFIRRLTELEIKQENELPKETILDPTSEVVLSPSGNTKVLVCSALCTHLGCIPIPYLGAYNV